jgi:hypothetical protein
MKGVCYAVRADMYVAQLEQEFRKSFVGESVKRRLSRVQLIAGGQGIEQRS